MEKSPKSVSFIGRAKRKKKTLVKILKKNIRERNKEKKQMLIGDVIFIREINLSERY